MNAEDSRLHTFSGTDASPAFKQTIAVFYFSRYWVDQAEFDER